MPNEIMSASESNSTPNSLVGAGQPRDAAVEHVEHDREADERRGRLVLAAHRVDDARVAAEHVAHREQAGQQVDAAAEAPARAVGRAAQKPQASVLPRSGFSMDPNARQCSTAMTVSPPRTMSPTLHAQIGARRQKHVHARAELHDAEPVAGAHLRADRRRGRRRGARGCRRSAARRSSARRDRSRSRCARWPSPRRGDTPAGTARACSVTRVTRAGRRHAVHVHVHRRQENADLLPRAGRRGGRGRRRPRRARGRRPATARRRRRRAADGRAIGIAEEEHEEGAEHQERDRQHPGDRRARRRARAASAPPMNGRPAESMRIRLS